MIAKDVFGVISARLSQVDRKLWCNAYGIDAICTMGDLRLAIMQNFEEIVRFILDCNPNAVYDQCVVDVVKYDCTIGVISLFIDDSIDDYALRFIIDTAVLNNRLDVLKILAAPLKSTQRLIAVSLILAENIEYIRELNINTSDYTDLVLCSGNIDFIKQVLELGPDRNCIYTLENDYNYPNSEVAILAQNILQRDDYKNWRKE